MNFKISNTNFRVVGQQQKKLPNTNSVTGSQTKVTYNTLSFHINVSIVSFGEINGL